jgi:predicted nucleic acid-binding protein
MRVFLDANILFSASKSDGAIRRLLERLIEGGQELWVDAFVVEEARRNLATKFPESLGRLEFVLENVKHLPTSARAPLPAEVAGMLPEKDRPVLAAAIRACCDALVTGDRTHFGSLYGRTVNGVTIHSPSSLAASVLGFGCK